VQFSKERLSVFEGRGIKRRVRDVHWEKENSREPVY